MCVGVPLQLLHVDGTNAVASDGSRTEQIDLSLVGSQPVGSWVLTFLGAAREVISAEDAKKISDALAGLERLMQGGELGDAFADIEEAGPSLPPHLEAARAAGRTQA